MKKECVERAHTTHLTMSATSLYVTTLKVKGTDARRCIAIVVRKDGKARNDRIRKENRQDRGNYIRC